MVSSQPARRRSILVQDRSRQTRQRLVRAAIQLWTRRGFERGVEQTTVEEIVQAAGVTKGTFYFHFARKEEILLEMGWESAEVVAEEARRCLKRRRPLDDSVARVIAVLVRQIRAAPPDAVGRAASEFRRSWASLATEVGRASFATAFEALFLRAKETAEIDHSVDAKELAQMMQVLIMDTILDYAAGHVDLAPALRRRCALLLAGVPGAERSA
jgi:AcrR family transcriptional regulator